MATLSPEIRPLLGIALCGKSTLPEPRETTTAGENQRRQRRGRKDP
jgi:hypothetical protein